MKAWFGVILAGALGAAAGCRGKGAAPDESPLEGGADCDPTDPLVGEGAAEVCDGVDNDCDGETDEGVTTSWYPDADGDGFGSGAAGLQACAGPDGYLPNGDDCDDADAAVNPMAAEVCDGADNDCDAVADDGLETTFYLDSDGDGYGAEAVEACEAPPGAVEADGDCDDADAAFHPGAAEDCADPTDYNCDGASGYTDGDGDGWAACEECDDGAAVSYPGAAEVCDGADNDCDAVADDGLNATFYLDNDGDGYGDEPVEACEAPAGASPVGGDCDDGDALFNPGAAEDCADPTDYNCDGASGYADGDGDGWAACEECDDADAGTHPGAAEVCDGADNDCDGGADDGLAATFYRDDDADGYGSAAVEACEAPPGAVEADGDCDDADPAVNPGEKEDCATGADDDCDGTTNGTNVLNCQILYRDDDGDGYGDPADGDKCYCAPKGYFTSSNMDDCDDDAEDVHPAAAEVCDDSVDNDCSGAADDECEGEEPDGWDGAYTGPFIVEVTTAWFGITDTCEGTASLKVEEGASPAIAGVATCEFSGGLALWTSTLTFTIEGDITADPAAAGTIRVLDESDTWEGSFAGDALSGEFEGAGTVGGVDIEYDGTFSVAR